MKCFIYGVILYILLALPPIIELFESLMFIHMHIQMPLLAVVGILWTPLIKQKYPNFFDRWNEDGVPGLLLLAIVITYWIIPRAMDDAITHTPFEVFKFISWPLFVGVAFKDSWEKLTEKWQHISYIYFSFIYGVIGFIYIFAEDQLCNNYLIIEQRILGWSFLFIALSIFIYFFQLFHHRKYKTTDT